VEESPVRLSDARHNERVRIPAEEIIHIYTIRRPGQTRGITEYAPIMVQLNILGAYIEAELTAARVSASACYTVEPTEGSDDGLDEDDEEKVLDEDGARHGPSRRWQGHDARSEASGVGVRDVPARRAAQHRAGLHTAYSSLTGDLSQANYGSQRQGLLSERDGYKRAQRTIATKLYRRVYLRWLKFALTTGAVDLPDARLSRASAHSARIAGCHAGSRGSTR
jgi:lambda family phage portal protein